MTDVSKTPEKKRIRRALVAAALETLERQGWKVARVKGGGKGRLRRITKNGKSQLAAIRTSQDGWLGIPRTDDDASWVTLSEVDVVVVSAVDDPTSPKFALVHIFDATELRERFDRAYAARREAGHSLPVGRGVWVSLYHEESTDPVNRVGAGIGLLRKPVATVPLDKEAAAGAQPARVPTATAAAGEDDDSFEPLTIAQAKARLARTLGVDPGNVKITVEA